MYVHGLVPSVAAEVTLHWWQFLLFVHFLLFFYVVRKVHIVNLKSRRGTNCLSVFLFWFVSSASISCQHIFHSVYAIFTEKDISWILVSILTLSFTWWRLYQFHITVYVVIFTTMFRYNGALWLIGFYFDLFSSSGYVYQFHVKVYFIIFHIIFRGKDIWNGWEIGRYQRHKEEKIPIYSIYVSYTFEAANYIYIIVILIQVRGIFLSK